ncbi:MAG: hypothetical protein HN742_22510 [Lentisphaerae bacterium]|jgi:hypothetical protein|nr:hypothetical protein [Lentisphaerota bacterium]MBT4818038.1 hypothetical protein [Lentisphaerota bacterium]MBT5605008.1 hypothetical protein [Lentisphaerota bacterium]MBT7054638.1 hypothetical protein [Lentisphaerota bacterium]MBT7844667.1 hypothetical protein [Lentisphaerota bacterium]
MTPLTVSLRQLYQRRAMWFVYVLGGTMLLPWIMFAVQGRRVSASFLPFMLLVANIVIGMVSASLVREIIACPFTLCLPGRHRADGHFLLVVGWVSNAVLGLVFLSSSAAGGLPAGLLYVVAVVFGMTVFLLSVSATYISRHVNQFLGFLPMVALLMGWANGHVLLDWLVRIGWPMVFLLCTGLHVWLVTCAATRARARRLQAAPFLGLLEAFNFAKAKAHRERLVAVRLAKRSDGDGAQGPGAWFGALLDSTSLFTWRKAAASACFEIYGALTWRHIAHMLWCIALGIVVTYVIDGQTGARRGTVLYLIFVAPVMMGIQVPFPCDSSLLLPRSRAQRFWGTMCVLVSLTVGSIAFVCCIAELSQWLAAVVPPITLRGREMAFSGVDSNLWPLTLLVIPVGCLCQLLLPNNLWRMLPVMFLFPTAMLWIRLLSGPTLGLVFGAAIAGWVLFAFLLHRHCLRGCLGSGA